MKKRLTILFIIIPLFVFSQNKYIEGYGGVFSLWWLPGLLYTKNHNPNEKTPYNFGLTLGRMTNTTGNSFNLDIQYHEWYNVAHLTFSPNIRVMRNDSSHFFFKLGPFMSILVKDIYKEPSNKYEKIYGGVNFGFGFIFKLYKHLKLFIDYSVNYDITTYSKYQYSSHGSYGAYISYKFSYGLFNFGLHYNFDSKIRFQVDENKSKNWKRIFRKKY